MTNEEKLTKLLQIAVDNGWEDKFSWYQDHTVKIDNDGITVNNGCVLDDYVSYSLNDLILNWEKDKTSFTDALAKASKDFDTTSCAKFSMSVMQSWILQRTSQRLDWLFKTFEHLL